MKRFLWPFLSRIVIFLIILLVCNSIYNRLQQEYTADISFDITYDKRIRFKTSAMGLFYQGKGDDSLMYGLIYEMDSLEWQALKASGEDMRIKDAIVIQSNLKASPEHKDYDTDTLPIWRVDTEGDSLHASAVHYNLDFTDSPGCFLSVTFRGNIFGDDVRDFGVKLSYTCWSRPAIGLGGIPDDFFIAIPPNINIQTIPQYTTRNTRQVEFSKEDLVNFFPDGIVIEGQNPHNVRKYDSWIFFLGAILGALMSWFVSFFDNYLPRIVKKMRREKKVVADGGNDDRSVAGVVEINLPVSKNESEPETEKTPVPSNE